MNDSLHNTALYNKQTPTTMNFLDIVMGLVVVVLVYMTVEDPLRARIFFGRTRIRIKSWYKFKVAHWAPWTFSRPIDMAILGEAYWNDVAEVASHWNTLPYSSSDRVRKATCRIGLFRWTRGYLVAGFFVNWPVTTNKEGQSPTIKEMTSMSWGAPVDHIFIPTSVWEEISKTIKDGLVVRVREQKRVSSLLGTFRMMVFSESVKSLSKGEIAKLKAIDEFVA